MIKSLSFVCMWNVIKRELFLGQLLNPVKLLGLGVLVGVISILLSVGFYSDGDISEINSISIRHGINIFYNMAMFFGMCGMIGNINNRYSNKGEMIGWLTLPATNLEKYLSKLITAFIFIPVYLYIMLWISEIIRVLYFNIFYSEYTTEFIFPLTSFIDFGADYRTRFPFMIIVISYFFFASFIFRKNTLFKVLLSGFVLAVLSVITVSGMFVARLKSLIGDWARGELYDNVYIESISSNSTIVLLQIFAWLCILFLLVWPYFRMKETELIQRF